MFAIISNPIIGVVAYSYSVQKYIMLIKYYVKQGLNNVIPCNCIRFWVLCYFKDYGNQGYVKPGPTVISIK